MSWFNINKEKKKENVKKESKPKEMYYYFNLIIDERELIFVSKQKNQIEGRFNNLMATYNKAGSFTFKVVHKDIGKTGVFSFDIEKEDNFLEIIIPNLREVKLIKKGVVEF